MTKQQLLIPNTLNMTHKQAEDVIKVILANLDRVPLVYDMRLVEFVTPHSALLLLTLVRHIANTSGYRVCFTNLQTEVHAYLERIDFFTQTNDWAYTDYKLPPDAHYSRSKESNNLLEITHLSSAEEEVRFLSRARAILSQWLPENDPEIDRIVRVLAEICSNVLDHSEDQGHVMIQRYRRADAVEVNIVVVDLGIGITESLSRVHGQIACSDSDYILRALEGYSAREGGIGGSGLQFVTGQLAPRNGLLVIRSCEGLVAVAGSNHLVAPAVSYLPGTQVSLRVQGMRS